LPQEFKIDGQSEIKEPIGMYGGRLEASFHVVVNSSRNVGDVFKVQELNVRINIRTASFGGCSFKSRGERKQVLL
jgi:cell division ATPase FtsA